MRRTISLLVWLAAGWAFIAAATPLAQAEGQLLTNGDFEQPLGACPSGPWCSYRGTLSRSEDFKNRGQASGQFALDGTAAGWFFQTLPASAGAVYRAEGYVLQNDTRVLAVYLRLAFYDSTDGTGPTRYQQDSDWLTTAPQWRPLSTGDTTAPPEARSLRVELVAVPDGVAGGTVYADDLLLTQVSPPPTAPATATATFTPSATPSATPSPAPTATASPSPSATASATRTPSPTKTPTPSPTVTLLPTPLPAGYVVISEVLYDPIEVSTDTAFEWIEIHNTTSSSLWLSGWSLADNVETDPLPDVVLPPYGYALILASQANPATNLDVPRMRPEDGSLGNGLANTGDRLALFDGAGALVDALSFGSDATFSSPPCPLVAPGHSLYRVTTDTLSCPFADGYPPSPGGPQPQPSPAPVEAPGTSTPLATPPPVAMAPPMVTWSRTSTANPTSASVAIPQITVASPTAIAEVPKREPRRPVRWLIVAAVGAIGAALVGIRAFLTRSERSAAED